MGIQQDLSAGFKSLLDRNGKAISINYYNISFPNVYDDDVVLTQSGTTLWTNGIVLPIKSMNGTVDTLLLEQGKLIPFDQTLFVNGSLQLATENLDIKIGLGSPTEGYYSIIPNGVTSAEDSAVKIYKKIYIRKLTNGSLIGES